MSGIGLFDTFKGSSDIDAGKRGSLVDGSVGTSVSSNALTNEDLAMLMQKDNKAMSAVMDNVSEARCNNPAIEM